MAQAIAPLLPSPPSWYPGHMRQFTKMLPALLGKTDVVLELRDARLPLTSINPMFEVELQKWRAQRAKLAEKFASTSASSSEMASLRGSSSLLCERYVIFNKRDLVPEWGIEPFQEAMKSKFPAQKVVFASWNRPKDVKKLHETIVNIARENVTDELNVLVVGMPNVGKSTLLNALRSLGIPGPTAKALRTSSTPGLTRAVSTRLKLSQEPLVYSFDSPGVMVPFLGKGESGAERGLKLALIAGIREGSYSPEILASYLLYRLNILNPASPVYLSLLPPDTAPTGDVLVFLDALALRLGMLKRGGVRDHIRAATWFVNWWRQTGCALSGSESDPALVHGHGTEEMMTMQQHTARGGWGFDFQWTYDEPMPAAREGRDTSTNTIIRTKMEGVIDEYLTRTMEESKDGGISATQERKREKAAAVKRRQERMRQRQ